MKKLLIIMLLALAGTACGGDFEDGEAAYSKNNYSVAIAKYKLAAAKGHAGAQYRIGFMYHMGVGVTQDDAEALKWYKLAAAQGDAEAQFYSGFMYDTGRGVVQNSAEALKWYKLASAQGNASARVLIGRIYEEGEGVVQDYVRAHMWYNLSVTGGGGVGASAARDRDLVEAKMTTQQIAKAQELARECQARNFEYCD